MTDLPRRVADRLAAIDGVTAVVLGGSHASGRADRSSDIDLGIYYEPGRAPDLAALRDVGTQLQGGRPAEIASFGEWGPWVNGGCWLLVEGTQVDWIFRDLARVDTVFDDCIAGRVTCDYYLGHPHGFHNHFYLAEVHLCEPLRDTGVVADLKARIDPYPPALGQALIEKYLYDASFMLDLGEKSVPRGDVFHAAGCLFRCAAGLIQVVFALNERFTMNEKKALGETETFARRPSDFATRTTRALAHPGEDSEALRATFDAMRRLLDETRALAPKLSYEWKGNR
jgi:hypothetical protein